MPTSVPPLFESMSFGLMQYYVSSYFTGSDPLEVLGKWSPAVRKGKPWNMCQFQSRWITDLLTKEYWCSWLTTKWLVGLAMTTCIWGKLYIQQLDQPWWVDVHSVGLMHSFIPTKKPSLLWATCASSTNVGNDSGRLMSASLVTLSAWLFNSFSVVDVFWMELTCHTQLFTLCAHSHQCIPQFPSFCCLLSSNVSPFGPWPTTQAIATAHSSHLSESFFSFVHHLPWQFSISTSLCVCYHFLQASKSQPSTVLVMCVLEPAWALNPVSWKRFPHQ